MGARELLVGNVIPFSAEHIPQTSARLQNVTALALKIHLVESSLHVEANWKERSADELTRNPIWLRIVGTCGFPPKRPRLGEYHPEDFRMSKPCVRSRQASKAVATDDRLLRIECYVIVVLNK